MSYEPTKMTPIEAIREHMQRNNLAAAQMLDAFGSYSRAWEIMNKRRPLSLRMIRVLHFDHGIDAATLIQPYELER